MRVLLFAALRDIAGTARLDVEGARTVGELLEDLAGRFGSDFARIASAGSVVVDGERADPGRSLGGEDEVAVLPPVSGG